MSEIANPTRRNGKANAIIFVVALLAMGIGAYFYMAREQPYYYESEGNIIRFENIGLAQDCAKLDFSFPITDKLNANFEGLYNATGGLIEMDCAFRLKIEGTTSGFAKELPITREELIEKITMQIDEKLKENNCKAEIIEFSSPNLKKSNSSSKVAKDSDESAKAAKKDESKTETDESSKDDPQQ